MIVTTLTFSSLVSMINPGVEDVISSLAGVVSTKIGLLPVSSVAAEQLNETCPPAETVS